MVDISLSVLLTAVGELKDDSESSKRFRKTIESAEFTLKDYERWIDECFTKTGEQYNNALQDIVNALGKKIGFDVEYGRYKGKKGEIGFDGLWKSQMGRNIVIDTKTTSAYTIQTSQVIEYINQLSKDRENIEKENTFGLYVVGKFEPTTLVDTIRGSVHRNKLRVITCKDLLEIANLKKDKALEHSQILSLLLPFDNINIGGLLQIIRDVLKVQEEELGKEEEVAEEEEEKKEEAWKIDGRKWHLEQRTTPELSDALKSFVDRVAEWGIEPSWNQKFYVGFKPPKIPTYWSIIQTWRVSFLKARIRTKKGAFKEDEIRSRLDLPVTVDTQKSKKYDIVYIEIRNKSEVESDTFVEFLRETYDSFKSLFLSVIVDEHALEL